MRLRAYLYCLALCISPVLGNVEKTIFLAPEAITIPHHHPNLNDLHLDALSPSNWALRRQLTASFPGPNSPEGTETWLLIDGLRQNQRYEVRICWAATQPTSFTLKTHTLPEVFKTPDLITSLGLFSESIPSKPEKGSAAEVASGNTIPSSVLFLQIFAAADYFSSNKTLMQYVPPVNVDIILDPYIFNVFPKTLRWTAAHLITLAVLSWYLSAYISRYLHHIAHPSTRQDASLNTRATLAHGAKKDT